MPVRTRPLRDGDDARTLGPMFQGIVEQIEGGGHTADWLTLEATADGAHAHAGGQRGHDLARDLDDLVGAHGCTIRFDRGFPPGETGLVLGNVLVVAALVSATRRALGGCHEFAHWLDRKHHLQGTHGDVWCLTLMLAWPLAAIRRGDGPVLGIPAELVVVRARMPSVRRILSRQGRLDDFV